MMLLMISSEEFKESKEFKKFSRTLKAREQERLLGFLLGLLAARPLCDEED